MVVSMSFYIDKLIVPLGLLEGYANFTMKYNGKFEQITNKPYNKNTLANLLTCVLSVYNPILIFQAFQVNLLNWSKSGQMDK